MSRVKLSSVIVLVLLGPVAQPLLAASVSQNFDSDPASWVGSENMTAPQSFGFSATNNAGGVLGAGTGEAGGLFVRETLGVYSTDVGSLDPSNDALSMSGRGRFTDVAQRGDRVGGEGPVSCCASFVYRIVSARMRKMGLVGGSTGPTLCDDAQMRIRRGGFFGQTPVIF